jgi:hypothetical protein
MGYRGDNTGGGSTGISDGYLILLTVLGFAAGLALSIAAVMLALA